MGKRIEVVPYRTMPPDEATASAISKRIAELKDRDLYLKEAKKIWETLQHKRALKAAQMRRYRAKKAGK